MLPSMSRRIYCKGIKLNGFRFADELDIEINEIQSIAKPFRYVIENNKLIISEELVEYQRETEEF